MMYSRLKRANSSIERRTSRIVVVFQILKNPKPKKSLPSEKIPPKTQKCATSAGRVKSKVECVGRDMDASGRDKPNYLIHERIATHHGILMRLGECPAAHISIQILELDCTSGRVHRPLDMVDLERALVLQCTWRVVNLSFLHGYLHAMHTLVSVVQLHASNLHQEVAEGSMSSDAVLVPNIHLALLGDFQHTPK
jgi:hypothetical protein